MSKFSWRNGLAVGIVAGACVTTLVILCGQAIYDLAQCDHDGQCYRYAAKHEGQHLPPAWWWGWEGNLVTSSDSLAQWVMMIFTVVAAILLYETLNSTRKMVFDTREIGNKQLRPYVFCRSVAWAEDESTQITFTIENAGQTPADSVEVDFRFLPIVGTDVVNEGIPSGGHNKIGQVFPRTDIRTTSGGAAFDPVVFSGQTGVRVEGSVKYYDPIMKIAVIAPFLFITKASDGEFERHANLEVTQARSQET